MKIFQIFFLLILLLGINSQINNNPINNTIKVINNINKTNDDINVLHRNDVVQNEEIKNAKKLINNTKIENVKIEYVSQDNPEKGQIKTNKEQVKTTTEQIKNQNIEKKENIQEQDKIINPNPNQNQQKIEEQKDIKNNQTQNQNQQKKEEQEDAINNQTQKQNNDQPKKEEKEKDEKINNNNNNNNDKAQKNNQQKNIDKGKEQNQKQNQNQNNSQQNLNYTQSNRTENDKDKQNEKNKLKEKVIKPDPEKVFNLTESLINFFKETFGAKSNETKTETETEEEKKRKQVEEETKKRLEAEREKKRKEVEEKKKKEKEKKAEDGRFEFFKILSNKTFEEIISMHIPKGEKETLYLDLDSFKKIYIAVTTSDLDLNEKFNFFFSGPNARGRTAAIYQIYNKNYLFWEYETLRKGEFIAEITNKGTKDNDLVFFFGKYEEKKKDRIDTEKIDKISMLLNDIDSNVNQIRNKKSIEIKQANSHNEKVTKNNKWIVIYSIIEIITMSLVFLIQSCYINSLVKAL